MNKILRIVTLLALMLSTSTAFAAPISSIQATGGSLLQCADNVIEGTLTASAYTSGGAVVTGFNPNASFTTGNGGSASATLDLNSGESYRFYLVLGSGPVQYVDIVLSADGASSEKIRINCDGSVQIGSPAQGPAAGDARLNAFNCDLTSALYAVGSGISVWDIGADSKGSYKGVYTLADVGDLADAAPEVNTFVKSLGHTSLEVLTTGEYQIKIGPDETGKVCTMVADGLPPSSVYFLP
jgi:hypothetical protein